MIWYMHGRKYNVARYKAALETIVRPSLYRWPATLGTYIGWRLRRVDILLLQAHKFANWVAKVGGRECTTNFRWVSAECKHILQRDQY
jgi:hypothetical protein